VQAEQSCHLRVQWNVAWNAGAMFVRETEPMRFDQDSATALVERQPTGHLAADVTIVGCVFAHRRADFAGTLALLRSDREGFRVSSRKEPGGAVSDSVIAQLICDAETFCR